MTAIVHPANDLQETIRIPETEPIDTSESILCKKYIPAPHRLPGHIPSLGFPSEVELLKYLVTNLSASGSKFVQKDI
jgi:hypothetical protein